MLSREQLQRLKRGPVIGRNRIPQAMEMLELTQVEVAAGTGYTQSYVSRVRSGQYAAIPGETMRTFAVFFGCAIEDLFPAVDEAVAS